MPRTFLKKIMPDTKELKKNKVFKFLGPSLLHPKLWGVDRRSIAISVAIGLFVGMIPIPFQMFVVALIALIFHFNLPIGVAMVWISNPVTMPFLFYAEYYIGSLVLDIKMTENFEFTIDSIWNNLGTIGIAMYFGAFLFAIIISVSGYILINILWRMILLRKKKERKQ
jgi:uncharacterized protein (DUF2062 family)